MINKVSAVLLAAYLMVGCSSGGGTSGAGGGGSITVGEFILLASFTSGSISVDTIQTECGETDPAVFEEFSTTTGTFTITIINRSTLPAGLFPTGLFIESYTVSYTPISSGAPGIGKRSYSATANTIGGSSITTQIIIVDLSSVLPEIQSKNPSGRIDNYTVTVTVRGRTLSGENFAISSAQFMEFGNFDTCPDAAVVI